PVQLAEPQRIGPGGGFLHPRGDLAQPGQVRPAEVLLGLGTGRALQDRQGDHGLFPGRGVHGRYDRAHIRRAAHPALGLQARQPAPTPPPGRGQQGASGPASPSAWLARCSAGTTTRRRNAPASGTRPGTGPNPTVPDGARTTWCSTRTACRTRTSTRSTTSPSTALFTVGGP